MGTLLTGDALERLREAFAVELEELESKSISTGRMKIMLAMPKATPSAPK